MKKLILFVSIVLPMFLFAQNERAQLERDLDHFIVATNTANCQALMYYAPKMVFIGRTEAEFLFDCEHNRLDPMDFMKKTLQPRYIIDTLVISDGSKYAKARISTNVEVEFADTEEDTEYHSDSFYYRLVEAYCGQLLERPDVTNIKIDHESHRVYYTCHTNVLGLWEDGHWRFLKQEDTEALPPLEFLDPDILFQ